MDRQALHEYIENKQVNICAVEAVISGETAYSDCFHGFQPGDTVHVMSVTKSVVSLLVGVALTQGLIRSVDEKVLSFFPEYPVKRGEKTIGDVTLRHILTMTAPYKYKSEPWTKVCSSDDWTYAALDLLGGRRGITGAFLYSTLGVHILTGVLSRVSGMDTAKYANRYLFEPLGIAPRISFEAKTAEEHKAFILSKAPRGNLWFVDPKGVAAAGYGLCLSAREMAKIGQLCVNGGEYAGRRIVSREWIEESTRPRMDAGEGFANMRYGYLWWTPNVDSNAYAALGNSGNVIYIDPDAEMVVAVASTFRPSVLDRVSLIRDVIVPCLSARGVGK